MTKLQKYALKELEERKKRLAAELEEQQAELDYAKDTLLLEKKKQAEKLKLEIAEAMERRMEDLREDILHSQIQAKEEEKERLDKLLNEVTNNKKTLDEELENMRKSLKPIEDAVPEEPSIDWREFENTAKRFKLRDRFEGENYSIELSYILNDHTHYILIRPEDHHLEVKVDSIEMAEDLSDHLSWSSEWLAGMGTMVMPSSFSWRSLGDESCEDGVFFLTKDVGFVEFGAYDSNRRELYLHNCKTPGMLLLENLESINPETSISEKKWFAKFYSETNAPTPYVLSKEAIEAGWMPQEGRSGLPRKIKKNIPIRMRYWKNPDNAKAMRDELVGYMDTHKVYAPLGEEFNGQFTMIRENAEDGPNRYYLIVNGREFTTDSDLLAFPETLSLVECELHDQDFGKKGPIEVDGKTAKAVDWGPCAVFENFKNRLTIGFKGARFGGVWELDKLEDGNWTVELKEAPRCLMAQLDNDKVDKIIELSQEGLERPQIAEEAGCSKRTVYEYQKALGFV